MKTLILILSLFVFTAASSAQEYATLRIGSTDASTLSPGDAVFVPFIADDISNIVMGFGFKMSFDSAVITWNGTSVYPAPGVSYIHPNLTPLGGDWLFNNNEGNNILFSWIDPTFNGAEINPGDTIIVLHFTYWGGETELKWEYPEMYDQNFEYFYLTLIDGCVCYLTYYDVTFHVTSNGNDLEGAWVTVGNDSIATNNAGLAVFNLQDGEYSYTVTKDGFVDEDSTFIVAGAPLQVEVEMENCWYISIHILSNGMTLTDSALVIVNNDTVWTTTGGASFCVENSFVTWAVYVEGYYPNSGSVILPDPWGFNLNVIMMPILYDVTFFVNCCGEPLGGIMLTIGTTTVVTGPDGLAAFNLTEGDYTIEINGYIFTFSVPETNYVDADICSEVTFHITNEQGYPLDNVLIDVDGSYLITDFNGEADTCLQVGNYSYSASKLGYINQTGTFEMDTIPQTVEIVMTLTTWAVSFNCPANCANNFNGWQCQINGEILNSGETTYLTNGSWDTYISWLGCWGGVMGQIIVNNAPVNIGFLPVDNPKATFHVQSQTGNLQGAAITVDTFSLITNNSGEVSFCLPGGYHTYIITKEGYDTLTGNFTWSNYCQDTTLNFLMNPVSIEDERNLISHLYPNPSSSKFYLEIPNSTSEPIELQVMDLTGRIVCEKKQAIPETIEIDLSNQQKGMYFLRIKSEEENYTQKLIIQ